MEFLTNIGPFVLAVIAVIINGVPQLLYAQTRGFAMKPAGFAYLIGAIGNLLTGSVTPISSQAETITVASVKKDLRNNVSSILLAALLMVVMGLWHDFTILYLVDGVILGVFLAVEAIFGLGTVNKRKTPKWNFRMRCFAVFYLFAINSMIFTLTPEQMGQVFRGFLTMTGGPG